MKEKLDHKTIENLPIKDKPYKVHDSMTKGLFILVHTNGSKYFRINFTFESKQKTLALGVFPNVSLIAARLEAAKIRSQLSENKNPSKERKKGKGKANNQNKHTFKKIALKWIELKSNEWKPDYTKDVLKSLEFNVFPYIGDKPINKIKPKKLTKVLEKIEKRGSYETLKKVRQRCNGIFIYAKVKQLIKSNPCEGQELVLKKHTSTENFNSIDIKELPQLIEAIHTTAMELTTKTGLLLALYTFVRTSEIRFARWDEISFIDKQWLIPAERMKMNKDHIVPLSKQAIKALKDLHPITGHFPFVFASRSKPDTKPFSENAMLYALYRMGYRGKHTVHGFRHLATTILNELGFERRHIEKQMSHVIKNSTEKRYNRAEFIQDRTAMMQIYADYVDKSDGSNIVPIGHKKIN
ncbi:tyrosine-type recombinase/integrase [Marinicella marina]|uniref:tyrosine-type recombinase/integrase n=1 Tax=Marinicella marina TaxID=2996016 RepID=UPI0024BC63E1|nr:tyrosine-type recombinase/integrase [Marinicella marina]MDJ1138745.1 tyrosine-type recombinase/integrase [Marinicella marina]